MDYRTKTFQEKFAAASAVLGVSPQEIMSVKMRDMINSYSEYDAFFHELEHLHNLTPTPVSGQFQGKGFSFSDGQSTVILVQHESGLEILNTAASVASLIGLVPLVVQAWHAFRRHRHHYAGHEPHHEIEIRRIDAEGNLIEEHAHSLNSRRLGAGGVDSFPFVPLLENELRRINAEVTALTARVHALEASKKPLKKKATIKRRKAKKNG